ncbi:MAG: hypothetical protein KBC11_00210 [Candidatus Pacebacteria bacterium]|nr:hypothetical protein [Candidatus Paceibacterota bacterium]
MNKEEIQMLEVEGLNARVRNKLSSITTLFCIIGSYHKSEDPKKLLAILDVAKKTFIVANESLKAIQDLATHTGNWVLQKKLKELDLYFVQTKEFMEEKGETFRKHKSFSFNTKAQEHEDLIEEIIKTTV